jgi:hypothetical protein
MCRFDLSLPILELGPFDFPPNELLLGLVSEEMRGILLATLVSSLVCIRRCELYSVIESESLTSKGLIYDVV